MFNHPKGNPPRLRAIAGGKLVHAQEKCDRIFDWADQLRALNRKNPVALAKCDVTFSQQVREHQEQLIDAVSDAYDLASSGSHEVQCLLMPNDGDFCGVNYGDTFAFTRGFSHRVADLYKASHNHAVGLSSSQPAGNEPLSWQPTDERNSIVDDFYFDGIAVLAKIRSVGDNHDAREIGAKIPVVFFDAETIIIAIEQAVSKQNIEAEQAISRLLYDPLGFMSEMLDHLETESEQVAKRANHPVSRKPHTHQRQRKDSPVRGVESLEGQPRWSWRDRLSPPAVGNQPGERDHLSLVLGSREH